MDKAVPHKGHRLGLLMIGGGMSETEKWQRKGAMDVALNGSFMHT